MNEINILNLLKELIEVDSVNPPGNEKPVAEILAEWLITHGINTKIHDLGNNRANLVACLKGNSNEKGLAFLGHMDTVPIGTEHWTYDPFGGKEEEGWIIGRGASDMKSGLAAFAGALVSLKCENKKMRRDIYMICTSGEEVDNYGTQNLLSRGVFRKIDALVVGEPTGMELAIAHKGVLWIRVIIPGRMAHGSTPHLGSNAIIYASRFLQDVLSFEPPFKAHPLLSPPTINPGKIVGGVSANIVPDRCEVVLDIRTLPEMDHASIHEHIRKILVEVLPDELVDNYRIEILLDRAPIDTNPNQKIVRNAISNYHRVYKISPTIIGMSYFTDASVIAPTLRIPTIVIGPGELKQAHNRDERVEIKQVLLAKEFYKKLAFEYAKD